MTKHLSTHCSTCGKKFIAPRSWRYCSKVCQFGRLGWKKRESKRSIHVAHARLERIAGEIAKACDDMRRIIARGTLGQRTEQLSEAADRWREIALLDLGRELEDAPHYRREEIQQRIDALKGRRDLASEMLAGTSKALADIARLAPYDIVNALERLLRMTINRLEMLSGKPTSQEAQQ